MRNIVIMINLFNNIYKKEWIDFLISELKDRKKYEKIF